MIVKKEKSDNIVFDYKLKEFPLSISKPAQDFVNQQEGESSDFKISDLIAKQAGMSDLQRKNAEAKIEEMALQRLKEVEEKAYKEAYELGMIEGTSKAFDEKKIELEERISKFDEVLNKFNEIKILLMKENESALVKIMYYMAEKIALKEISQDKENIMRVLMLIIEDVQEDDRMVLRLNPEDSVFIQEMLEKQSKDIQRQLFVDLSNDEQVIYDILQQGKKVVDELSMEAKMPMSKTSSLLLQMEFKGLVKSLPGKSYLLA